MCTGMTIAIRVVLEITGIGLIQGRKDLGWTQKKLADLFEMKDSNLHKYLVGERKLNADLVLKLSSFCHLSPEYWLRVEVKNELIEITKEKTKDYQKYDYRNLLVTGED